ncbi:MAG TPA: AraC family transcriptional regulator [Slackia equolifaciens]|uniref:AraC family transcriptional regulator n=1 Tax=Slackia equolifaciens TaxID=498718 RepID=A0A9D3A1R4_9ACTN|nr:AraC family transcriptional regulator [Slackia equolifaciens]
MKGGIGSIRSLYEPQVEQLGVRLEQRGEALWGRADNCIARSQVWVRPLGDAGVITSHSMLVKTDTPFVEQSLPGLCIGALSADSLMLCPIARPHGVDPTCNVAVFGQQEGLTDCWLKAGSKQNATSIMLLPRWFDRFDAEIRKAGRALMEEPGESCANEHAASIVACIRRISPLYGTGTADERELAPRIMRATLEAIEWREERNRAERAAGCHEQASLVRATMRMVELNLGGVLSLDAIARDLFTSRSRLCQAFKQETGESLGSYVRRRRMEQASSLLTIRQLSTTEVARAVGYTRLASFDVAFERTFGSSPTAWRKEHGRV